MSVSVPNSSDDNCFSSKRSYATRQLIVVVADEILEAERQAKQQAKRQLEQSKQKGYLEIFSEIMIGTVARSTSILAAEIIIEAIRSWRDLQSRGIDVVLVSRTESESFQFPPGHPRDRVIYIAHPAINNVYYTASQFHRLTFEHKFSEAVKLLMALGAKEISVQHITGWSKDFAASVSTILPSVPLDLSGQSGKQNKTSSEILFKATLKGTDQPKILNDLVWYNHEPTWQQIAEGRINYGLENFVLNVRYDDDYGVNAGLKISVEKSGLDLGGKFESHQSTVWQLEGTFK
jgi:hypothetical protein